MRSRHLVIFESMALVFDDSQWPNIESGARFRAKFSGRAQFTSVYTRHETRPSIREAMPSTRIAAEYLPGHVASSRGYKEAAEGSEDFSGNSYETTTPG